MRLTFQSLSKMVSRVMTQIIIFCNDDLRILLIKERKTLCSEVLSLWEKKKNRVTNPAKDVDPKLKRRKPDTLGVFFKDISAYFTHRQLLQKQTHLKKHENTALPRIQRSLNGV